MLTTLHIQNYHPWQAQWARAIGVGWAKIVNPDLDTRILEGIAHTLVRFWCDDVAPGYIAQGYEGGRRFVRDQYERFRKVQAPGKVLELWNEPDCNTNEGLRNLNSATLGAIDEAQVLSVTLCILNLAEGNPHDNGTGNEAVVAWKWDQLRPCIKAAVTGGHYLGRHCYWRPEVEGPTGRYHALGRLADDITKLKDLGVDVSRLKVLVNETGIDGGIAGHTPQQGWQVLTDAATYRAQIVEAEKYARGIPQVEALMLFTAGFNPPWGSFDHDEAFCSDLTAPLKALDVATIPGPVLAPPIDKDKIVRVSQRFVPSSHYGIDYSCYVGTPLYAACDGIAYRGDQGAAGFGRYVRIEDGAGLYVYTAHMSSWAIGDGSVVHAGDMIGLSGNTGNSTGPHLHFEVRRGSRLQASAVDSEPMLDWEEEPDPPAEPYLPTNDPFMQARKTPQERYEGIRWWLEERRRQYEAGAIEYADQIDAALIEQMYKWEQE